MSAMGPSLAPQDAQEAQGAWVRKGLVARVIGGVSIARNETHVADAARPTLTFAGPQVAATTTRWPTE
jgi:hypothetical protein